MNLCLTIVHGVSYVDLWSMCNLNFEWRLWICSITWNWLVKIILSSFQSSSLFVNLIDSSTCSLFKQFWTWNSDLFSVVIEWTNSVKIWSNRNWWLITYYCVSKENAKRECHQYNTILILRRAYKHFSRLDAINHQHIFTSK